MPTNSTTRTAIAPPLAASSNMTGIRDAERNSNRNVSSCSTYLHSAIANWDAGQFSTFEDDNNHFSSFADNDRFTLISNKGSSSSSSEQHIPSEVASLADIESDNNNPDMCRGMEHLSPRTIVKRKWKSGKLLVGTAAEILGKQVKKMVPAKKVLKIVAVEKGASRRKIIQEANEKFVPVQLTITAKQKTVPMQRILATQKTAPVQNNPASTQKTMLTQNLALV
ncbi:unnamed protein product [Zymoseptoria tritici ST99CH_1A5]|uniref:Uncharacterized protein n=1 Tax=Zymoseptoria tritici ST99CH_1A5 TaxID=1276529 RepID=A0A1Y6M456_ZYMTR|nr:unnamed protein product [Zymoseptoria tritici ST99CH_1A5]